MGLRDDFQNFLESDESRKPAFEVREDWREWQLEQAILNGDIYADTHPNTDFEASWSEVSDNEELSEDEIKELDQFTSFSKKSERN